MAEFKDRSDAGKKLAERVWQLSRSAVVDLNSNVLVIGLPRGGLPVAYEIACKLNCPLRMITSKKIPLPGQKEVAIGAVSSLGAIVLNPEIPMSQNWIEYIEKQEKELLAYTKEMEGRLYRQAGIRPLSLKGKTVILVDDGVATGMTALAAIESARKLGARYTIFAAPVMSRRCFRDLQLYADYVIALSTPENMISVSMSYLDFHQLDDVDVVSVLKAASQNGNRNRIAI